MGLGDVWDKVTGADKVAKAAERGAASEEAALAERRELTGERLGEVTQLLQPFVGQEMAASTQLAAQMGLPTGPTGGGGGAMMAGGGFQGFGGGPGGQALNSFIDQMIRDQIGIAGKGGFKNEYALSEAIQQTQGILQNLKAEGKIPADYQVPDTDRLTRQGRDLIDQVGGHISVLGNEWENKLAQNPELANYGAANIDAALQQFGVTPGGVQAGGPGGMVGGPGELIDGETGEVIPQGPQAMTAGDIMERAGLSRTPEGFGERFFADVEADPRSDPELAAYLGLTPESMQVGDAYQQTPAYEAARTAGVEAVDTAAAGAGGLYSGRRGEALRDVGQDVEQRYYFDAMDRLQQQMQARRGLREADLMRRGALYETDVGREAGAYGDFMGRLERMSTPTTTTNLASVGMGEAMGTAADIGATERGLTELSTGAAGARQAGRSDLLGGAFKLGSAFLGG